jgi:hypothetical protein
LTIPPKRVVWRALWKATFQPAGLCSSGVLSIGAMFLQSGTLLGLALATNGAWAMVALLRRRFWEGVVDDLRREGPSLPFPRDFADPVVRRLATRLNDVQIAREEAWYSLPAPTRAWVRTPEKAADLEESALELLLALDRLTSHLTPDTRDTLQAQMGELTTRAENAAGEVRAEYRRALAALESRLASVDELEGKRQLLFAKLESAVCALEAMTDRLFRVPLRQAADRALAGELPTAN